MEKIKKSLFSRVSAIVLVFALVIGTIPTSIISAQAAADAYGTVESISEVGGTVDSTDASNIIVKYEGVSIKHVESNDTIGRMSSGWYVGAIMNVPNGMTDFANSAYTNAEGTVISLSDATEMESIYMWKQIDETTFTEEKDAGRDLEYTWEFDWDTTTEGTQKVVFTIDTATVTLSDEDTVKPVVETIAVNPSEWTKDAVVISGTVSDNFSGVKSVSYKQEGSEVVTEATLAGNNSFSFTVDPTVYEGKYIVWCTDNKDNVSENEEVFVYMDNAAPTVTAKVDVTDWTEEAVTISGTVDDNLSGVKDIYYQKTGETKVKLETFDAANGTYSITIPAQEYVGIYTVYCVDNANNEASTTVEVKMDNKAPEVTDVKADVTDWTNQSVVISGKVNDAISGVASVKWEKQGDNSTGTAVYDASSNTFSFEIAAQEYAGEYIITCTDKAGNVTAGNTVSVKMDNGSCVVATGAADKADWTNSSVVISGTVSDDLSGVASVTWTKEDDQTTGSATFDADNNAYSFEVAAQNYNGKYIITCTDKAGNVSAEFSVAVQMDVDVPAVESAKADVTKWTNGSVVISGEVSDNLSGVASVTWEKADGKASGDATYSVADNTYTFTLDAQEYAGEYIIKCTDKAGNVSEEKKVAVKMDNVIPTLTAKADVTDWTNGSVVISGEVSDNLSGVVSVSYGKPGAEAKVVELEEGATTYNITLGADDYFGNYEIYCTDAAGNTSDVQTVEVKMDQTTPVVESAKADVTGWTNGPVVISGKVSDLLSGVASVTWEKEEDRSTGTAAFNAENGEFTITLAAQDYKGKYIITCTDKAGCVSEEVEVEVKMDETLPSVTKAEASDTTWTNGQVVIRGTVEDNLSGVVSVSYKKTGTEGEQPAVFDPTKKEYTIALSADDYEGTYTIYCTDAANNKSADVTVAVKMDKTAPALSDVKADITDWTNGNVVITGNYEDNLSGVQKITVVKKEDNTTVPATMNAGGNTFSVVINAQNYEGDYIVTCTDAANNTSLAATVSVKMDNEQCVVATGVAESADWTNEKVVISGTVKDNLSGVEAVAWVKEGDATQKGIATFDADKNQYTFEVEAQNYEGNYIITCTDRASNVSAEVKVAVKMDVTKPVVEKAEANITDWTKSAITINGKVSDNLAGVEKVTWVKEDDNTTGAAIFNADNNTFTFDVSAQNYEGNYIITCTDKAGNVSAEVKVLVKMDITNPVVEKAEANIADWTSSAVTITGRVSDNLAGVEKVTWVKEDDQSTGTATFNADDNTFAFEIAPQNYEGNYVITCTDKAGNVSAEVKVLVKMDIANPVVDKAEANITDWTSSAIVISGKVSDNLAGVEAVTCIKESDKSELPVSYDVANGTFTVNISAQSYEGNYVVTCMDKAKNVSVEVKVAVKMDNAAPNDIKLTCGDNIWETIIAKVTFGLFYNNTQTMVVDGKDDLSGIKTIEYVEKVVALDEEITSEKLENVSGWEKLYSAGAEHEVEVTGKTGEVSKDPNRNIIYCVKVTDYADNVTYVTSDGLIFDTTVPTPALDNGKLVYPETEATAEVPVSKRPLFNTQTVPFDVAVTEATVDGVLQSGIKSVTYEIVAKDRVEDTENKATESGTLYTWEEGTDLSTEYTGKITVDSAKFNYNYVDLTVTVVDNAGNVTKETYEFAIDITIPTIKLSYDNNKVVGSEGIGERGYFDAERTATIVYTERSENWSQSKANDVLAKTIAEDVKEDVVQYTIDWTNEKGTTSDADTHTATIKFVDEVHYNVETPAYTDEAGNEATLTVAEGTKYPYVFSIDKYDEADSEATIEFKEQSWVEKFLHTITFGLLFSNESVDVTVTVKDDFAGIKEIKYLEKTYAEGKQKVEITEDAAKAYTGWETVKTFDADKDLEEIIEDIIENKENKDVVIFVWVTDYAGYERIYSSDGLIVDITVPTPALDNGKLVYPETEATAEVPVSKRPLFNTQTVPFDVAVTEATVDGVLQSGIKSVTYEIVAKDRVEDTENKATESGTLYTWEEGTDLSTEYTGKITVDSAKFNYNYVDLTVTVVDNAGNVTKETYEFAIDITAPEVAISYNMNVPVDEANDLGYFNCQRVAFITYTERTENWNAADAEKQVIEDGKLVRRDMIEALDINGEQVDGSYTIDWIEEEPEEKAKHLSDEDTHIAIVSFNPTNILEIEDESMKDTTDSDETVDSEESIDSDDSTGTIEPVTGADARYALDLSYTDAAGNSIAEDEQGNLKVTKAVGTVYPFNFVIDTVSPEVASIEYKETIKDAIINTLTFNYFGANAQVTVTLNDETAGIRNFDYEGLLDSGISAKNKAVIKTAVEGAEIVQQQEDKSVFVVKFTIPKEALTELNSFRGTVRVNAWDYSNNTVQKHDDTRLVVDKIAPTCQVTFDQPVKDVNGVSYYDKAFIATIVIDEANFYAEDVVINVNGQRVMPTDWVQTPGTDIWTSHVPFTAENDYVMTVNYTDRSGNVMAAYESNQRTLDTTEPVITVSNIKHESANNQETIGFTLTVTDKNMSLENVQPNVTAVVRRGESSANYTYERVKIDLGQPVVSTNDKGETVYTYTVTNLEIDGYYSLECTVVDHANHTVSNIGSVGANDNNVAVDVVNFSVNRGGSVFWIETEHNDKYSDKTFNNELNGAYANDKVTVKLHEVNVDLVDELEEEDKRTILTLNDGSDSKAVELVEKNNGTGNYDRNVAVGVGGWYETIYTLDNDQFAKDGTYSLNIITYDKAENSNVNTKNEEGTIKFVVDRTNPVVATNVKSGQIIDAEKYTVEFTIAEVNLDEKTIVVKLEGKEQVYEKVSSNTFKFEVENLLNDEFTIEVKDLAGNSAGEFKIDDLTVSTKWYVRWYANKPLFWGTIGGALVLSGAVIFFVVPKKRKKGVEA